MSDESSTRKKKSQKTQLNIELAAEHREIMERIASRDGRPFRDVVGRALKLYGACDELSCGGGKVIFQDGKSGEEEVLRLL